MMAHDTAVSLSHVSKRYGAVCAVDDISLEICRGETVALLGPNGAGKTTTLSMLLGLLPPALDVWRSLERRLSRRSARVV